jgi:hypothetical protein
VIEPRLPVGVGRERLPESVQLVLPNVRQDALTPLGPFRGTANQAGLDGRDRRGAQGDEFPGGGLPVSVPRVFKLLDQLGRLRVLGGSQIARLRVRGEEWRGQQEQDCGHRLLLGGW